MNTHAVGLAFVIFGLSVALCAPLTHARLRFASARLAEAQGAEAAQPARGQTTTTGEVTLTATSANVSGPGRPVSIRILRWSTDEERNPVVAALNPAPPTPPAAAGGGLPAGAGQSPSAAAGDRGGAARGGAGRGGRGGAGRGGRGDASAPPSPMAALTGAIGRAPTLGYIWMDEVTGYSIKYAYHTALPDGGERIILATDRRLGAHIPAWTPVAAAPPTDYEFTLIEIRLDSKGVGEGKTSLTTKVIADNEARTVALENYAATPAILQNVKASSQGSANR